MKSFLTSNNIFCVFNFLIILSSFFVYKYGFLNVILFKDFFIPISGQCYVSLTVNPSSAIFGSLVTFYSTLNCSVVPPFEYLCCYYFWQDNLSDNITVTAGLTTSYLSKIYETKHVKNHKYIMEVRVCWQKTFGELPISDIEYSVCDYSIALNTTTFELTGEFYIYSLFLVVEDIIVVISHNVSANTILAHFQECILGGGGLLISFLTMFQPTQSWLIFKNVF